MPWQGVKLADLLDEAGVQPSAPPTCASGPSTAPTPRRLTLDQARRDDVLVAHEMQGRPVTREHGGPVRLYVAPMYGYKSLKWLERIEVVDASTTHRPRLLGGAGLRRRRLGRAVQRPRRRADLRDRRPPRSPRSTTASSGSPRRARRCTGPPPPLFLVLLATGLILYVPRSPRWSAGASW